MQDRFSTPEDYCGPSQMWQSDNILIHCSFLFAFSFAPYLNPLELKTSKSKAGGKQERNDGGLKDFFQRKAQC